MCNNKNLPLVTDNALKVIEINENGQSYNIVDYFLSETIENKSYYYDFLRAVNGTSQYDEIHIHINNYGGDLDAAIQIYHSLVRSGAKIVIYIEGACMSAATVIMMTADEIEFCPWSSIMIHAYSGGDIGKYQEIQSASEFHREWFTNFMYDVYGDFLTKKELNQVLGGKDLWLSAEDAMGRFKKIFKKKEREYCRIKKENESTLKKINKIYNDVKDVDESNKDENIE
jgi:ATP-dependent protease ClpP protease subunit